MSLPIQSSTPKSFASRPDPLQLATILRDYWTLDKLWLRSHLLII